MSPKSCHAFQPWKREKSVRYLCTMYPFKATSYVSSALRPCRNGISGSSPTYLVRAILGFTLRCQQAHVTHTLTKPQLELDKVAATNQVDARSTVVCSLSLSLFGA